MLIEKSIENKIILKGKGWKMYSYYLEQEL